MFVGFVAASAAAGLVAIPLAWSGTLNATLPLSTSVNGLIIIGAIAAIEGFLLTAFSCLLLEPGAAPGDAPGGGAPVEVRSLRRAKDYIHAHLDRPLSLAEIARQACVSPRTLELVFKRHGEASPLAYARRQRLQAAHAALRAVAREGRSASVTDVALAHGFVHMGRFSAQYRAQFGCLPSQTLNAHAALAA